MNPDTLTELLALLDEWDERIAPDTAHLIDAIRDALTPAGEAAPHVAGAPDAAMGGASGVGRRFFVHDGESYDASYTSAADAQKAAEAALDRWRTDAHDEDGWADEVESVAWGEVIERAEAVPDEQSEVEDAGCDYRLTRCVVPVVGASGVGGLTNCDSCAHAYDHAGDRNRCGLTDGSASSFYDNVRAWRALRGATGCPGHEPRATYADTATEEGSE